MSEAPPLMAAWVGIQVLSNWPQSWTSLHAWSPRPVSISSSSVSEQNQEGRALGFPGGPVDKSLPADAGAPVRSLVQESSTGHGATKPGHSAVATEPVLQSPCSTAREAPAMRSPSTTQLGSSFHSTSRETPSTAESNLINT